MHSSARGIFTSECTEHLLRRCSVHIGLLFVSVVFFLLCSQCLKLLPIGSHFVPFLMCKGGHCNQSRIDCGELVAISPIGECHATVITCGLRYITAYVSARESVCSIMHTITAAEMGKEGTVDYIVSKTGCRLYWTKYVCIKNLCFSSSVRVCMRKALPLGRVSKLKNVILLSAVDIGTGVVQSTVLACKVRLSAVVHTAAGSVRMSCPVRMR